MVRSPGCAVFSSKEKDCGNLFDCILDFKLRVTSVHDVENMTSILMLNAGVLATTHAWFTVYLGCSYSLSVGAEICDILLCWFDPG